MKVQRTRARPRSLSIDVALFGVRCTFSDRARLSLGLETLASGGRRCDRTGLKRRCWSEWDTDSRGSTRIDPLFICVYLCQPVSDLLCHEYHE